MKLKNSTRRRVVRKFKRDLNKYPYIFPYYEGEVKFDNFNHAHVCIARLCGGNIFKQVCPHIERYKDKELKDWQDIGSEDWCDYCIYNVRFDFNCSKGDSGIEGIGFLGKPELKIACDDKLLYKDMEQDWG